MNHPRTALALLVAAAAAGCATEPLPPARQSVKPIEPLGPAFVSPARWDYHPPSPNVVLGVLRLGDGRCVFTADGGQRWLSAPLDASHDGGSPPKPPSKGDAGAKVIRGCGKAEASGFLAPEDLIGAIKRSESSWIFIGESGALYEASEPLGPFSRTIAAPEPFAKVAGAGSVVLGATYEGRLLRWEEASGWRPVASPPGGAPPPASQGKSAPPAVRVLDVAVNDEGRALALAFPEALYASSDGGASWSHAGAPTIGTRTLGRTGRGELAAQGLFETLIHRPSEKPAFARVKEPIAPSSGMDVDVARAPSTSAAQTGRAVIDGDQYYELLRPDNNGDEWRLARGRIEGRLEIVPLPKSDACANVRLGARGSKLVIACVISAGSDVAAELRRSNDRGTTWGSPAKLATPDGDQIHIAVSPEGAALVTGVCRSEAGACKPSTPLLLRPEGDTLRADLTAAPKLSGVALLPAFSPDARSAYFLGRGGKDDKISLFVSRDGGASFAPRSLDTSAIAKPPPRPRPVDEDEEPEPEPDGPDTFEVDDLSTLRPGEDGTIGLLLLRSRGGYGYVTTDEDGRVLHVASPPSDEATMGGFGRRVLAVAPTADGAGSQVWESADGGATWDAQPGPLVLTREALRGTMAVTCSLSGCIVGDTLTRVGWGGQSDGAPAERPPEPTPATTPSVLTPIVCDLAPTSKWTRIDHLHSVGAGPPLPDLGVVMRRRSVWSSLTVNHETGAVVAHSANLPESGDGEARVAAQTILPPHPANPRAATRISLQAEGYAALRAAIPLEKGQLKVGAPMRNLEVAWENYMTSASVRAKIPDAGPFERNDVYMGGPDTLNTGLISVSTNGIVVRPHVTSRAAFFIDGAGRVERLELPPMPGKGLGGEFDLHQDTAIVDGVVLGMGLVRDRHGATTAVMLSHRAPQGGKPGDRWETTSLAFAPPRLEGGPLFLNTDWAYQGKNAIGLTALMADPRHTRAWAFYEGLRADGTFAPPLPIATLFDLGDRPRPCSAAERAASPRHEVRYFLNGMALFPGMRHPVLIVEPPRKNAVGVSEPIVLLTGGAVIHGAPASPCVAGWEARSLRHGSIVTAVIPGDLGRAWLFRPAAEAAAPSPSRRNPSRPSGPGWALEYRPMACKYDPAARVPEAVWNEPGTARIER